MGCPGQDMDPVWISPEYYMDSYYIECSFCGAYVGGNDYMQEVEPHDPQWPDRLRKDQYEGDADMDLWLAAVLEVSLETGDGDEIFFSDEQIERASPYIK